MQIQTAGLVVIKDKRLLLAFSRNKQAFYLPGGKIDAGETAKQALVREIKEELSTVITEDELSYYSHITAPAFGETDGIIMEQDCYFITNTITPVASAEIGELRYFSLSDYQQEANRAPGVMMVLEQLKKADFID